MTFDANGYVLDVIRSLMTKSVLFSLRRLGSTLPGHNMNEADRIAETCIQVYSSPPHGGAKPQKRSNGRCVCTEVTHII